MIDGDVYRTIDAPFVGEVFKDKGSKFIGYAFPIKEEENVKRIVEHLKSEHYKARHWCYAWRLGNEVISYRANDDGEPSNSAGQPILGQLVSFGLTNVLVVVVRYFGGVKLGVGGLINAYRTSSKLVLESSDIVKKTVDISFRLTFEYEYMDKVMRVIKERRLRLVSQKMELNCVFEVLVRERDANQVKDVFEKLRCLIIK